jgi:hypothetical protein
VLPFDPVGRGARHTIGSLLLTCLVTLSAPVAMAASPKDCAGMVVAPPDGAKLTAGDPQRFELRLEWRPIDGVQSYTVEVGKQPDLRAGTRSLFAEVPRGTTSFPIKGVAPGHYYWRISAGDGRFRGPTCGFSIVPAPFPDTPSVLGAIPSGRPLVRWVTAFYCAPGGVGDAPKPFGLFFVRSEALSGQAPGDNLAVCTGDKVPQAFGHRFEGDLGLQSATSKTIHAGLLLLPNGAGLLVAVVPAVEGVLLACRTATSYQGVPVSRACEGAGVRVSVPDATRPAAIEIRFPDGKRRSSWSS